MALDKKEILHDNRSCEVWSCDLCCSLRDASSFLLIATSTAAATFFLASHNHTTQRAGCRGKQVWSSESYGPGLWCKNAALINYGKLMRVRDDLYNWGHLLRMCVRCSSIAPVWQHDGYDGVSDVSKAF